MIHFIHTSLLIGLAGVVLPLIIHLLARQKAKKILFSSLMYLKKIQNKHYKRFQMRQWLILLLRCLALLFLVLAFARPTLKIGSLLQGVSQTAAVLIPDPSLSMRRGDVWLQAKQRAEEIFPLLTPEDQLGLWESERTLELSAYYQNAVKSRFNALAPGWRYLNIESLLQEGLEALAESQLANRELYLISDFQRSAFFSHSESMANFSQTEKIYLLPVGGPSANMAVTDCGIENQIMDADTPLRVFAHIRHYGESEAQDVPVRLFIAGVPVAQKRVSVSPNGAKRVVLQATSRKTGWITCTVALEDEAFPPDNAAHFSFYRQPQPNVLIVASSLKEAQAIQFALAPQQKNSQSRFIHLALHDEPWSEKLNQADVLFLVNAPMLGLDAGTALNRFIHRRGGVVIIPGSQIDIRQINEMLLAPFGRLRLGNVTTSDETAAYRTFGRLDLKHPLLNGIFDEGKAQVRSPHFRQFITVPERGDAQVIVEYDQGDSFLVIAENKAACLLLFTSGIDPAWSDFALKPIFAPLMHRTMLYASQALRGMENKIAGEMIRLRLEKSWDVRDRYQVEAPDGRRFDLVPEASGTGVLLQYGETDLPGFYRFFHADSLVWVQAVNLDARESDFMPISMDTLTSRWPGANVRILKQNAPIERSIREARLGREIQRELLILALLLFLAELVLSQWTAMRSRFNWAFQKTTRTREE